MQCFLLHPLSCCCTPCSAFVCLHSTTWYMYTTSTHSTRTSLPMEGSERSGTQNSKGHECCEFLKWSACFTLPVCGHIRVSISSTRIHSHTHSSFPRFLNGSFCPSHTHTPSHTHSHSPSHTPSHSFSYSRHDSQRHGQEARFHPVSSPTSERRPSFRNCTVTYGYEHPFVQRRLRPSGTTPPLPSPPPLPLLPFRTRLTSPPSRPSPSP